MKTILLASLLSLSCFATTDTDFSALVESYLTDMYKANPSSATKLGIHDYDKELENCSREGYKKRAAELTAYGKKLAGFDRKKLSEVNQIDARLLQGLIDTEKLELETLKGWEKDPNLYSGDINFSLYQLINRDFAPVNDRLASLVEREKKALGHFACAKKNLKNPPKLFTELALDQLPSMIRFLEKDVPEAMKEATDPKLRAEFEKSNAALIAAFRDYETYLRKTVLPRSKGDYRLGAKLLSRQLLAKEMVTTPLPQLLEVGMKNLRENQEKFAKTAKEVDPSKTSLEVMQLIEVDHPPADKLLETVRGMLGDLRRFIVEKKLITLPSDKDPIVQETPPFKRAIVFASMNSPGPFEPETLAAYYNVTLPDPSWSPEHIEEHLRGYHYGTLISTSIHEAYPGHYTQFLWFKNAPTKLRKVYGSSSNKEGWAHYTEQMFLEEGYKPGDAKVILGQLQDALLRNCRYVVAIQLHSGKMTYDQAIDFFMKEGYQTRANAEREVRRGAHDGTYLVYTLGKLQILQLRDDYRAWKGEKFSLQQFHDDFVKQGPIPVPLIREILFSQR